MDPASIGQPQAEKVCQVREPLDDHLIKLETQMQQGKSGQLVRHLEFPAQFLEYSFGNMLLVLLEDPDATRVAGRRRWNRLGRYVRAREKGIMVLAAMTVRKRIEEKTEQPDEQEDEERITLFKVVYVFDVSQTEGQELPTLIHATGDPGACYPALQEAVRASGITLEVLERVPGIPSAHGGSSGGRIVIRYGLDPAEAFRTLAHEFAHELLHWPKDDTPKEPSRTVRETEADAAAFVVCRHFGIESDSADYLLLYNSEPKLLLDRLETIRQTAAQIIDAIHAAQGQSAAVGAE